MSVRYMLSKDCSHFYDENKNKIILTHSFGDNTIPYYVDILSPMEGEGICLPIKIKVFCPDGRIIKGFVQGNYITLSDKDALYDGRFNSDRICQ